MAAMNTHRQLGSNNAAAANNIEKLSSGLKINRAGDDAAGLAISEKMRGQIRGLDMAQKNSQDGISLIQTAEGALNETHDILQRMRELAVQSSNDTNTENDRGEIQKEVNQLAEEITRISENTEFNTRNLLGKDGKGFSGKFHIGANTGQDISLEINDMGAKALGVNKTTATAVDLETDISVKNLTEKEYTISYQTLGDKDDVAVNETTAVVDKDAGTIVVTVAQSAGDSTNPGAVTATKDDIAKALAGTGVVSANVAEGKGDEVATGTTGATATAAVIDPKSGIDISTQESADAAITVIQTAIDTVSAERSKLGATQNRLEHTINNLGTSSENLTAAESRIRDVDMAKEMMDFTKNNILTQAAQAMLSQSNQLPNGVLQLLR